MKGKLLVSMLVACMPWLAMAQSNDDLYYIPKTQKKVEKKMDKTEKVGVVPRSVMNETVNDLPAGTTLVVKDVKGNVRDVDEYNRRYTSKDNTFSYQNDTLMVTEKPYGERGEWVNDFEGSASDYEYAMRLVRFKNPRYMISVSSPLYWEVINGAFYSWDWNVYDDGLYAYVFPTYTNRLWWDWRFSPGFYGPHFSFGWGWSNPWYTPWYSGWYSPWYGGYWGGYWGSYWGGYWGGYYDGYYGHGHYRPNYYYNDRRGELYGRSHRDSYISNGRGGHTTGIRTSQIGDRRGRTGGRVIRSGEGVSRSSRAVSGRNREGIYTRPSRSSDSSNRVYTRPSSTRRHSSGDRYNSGSSRRQNTYNYSSGSSSRHSSGGSYRSGGGGSRHSGGGSVGRSGGGVRRR